MDIQSDFNQFVKLTRIKNGMVTNFTRSFKYSDIFLQITPFLLLKSHFPAVRLSNFFPNIHHFLYVIGCK